MVKLTLFGFYRSSCAARLRIALDLKGVEYKPKVIDLNNDEHLSEEYGKINPSRSVPTLSIEDGSTWKISQSIAALEYLEEEYPSPPLLPTDKRTRAAIRTLVNIIAVDVQPPTNSRIQNRAKDLGADMDEWTKSFTSKGLQAFETVVSSMAGKYCCGDTITLADVCLAPAVWNAERFGVPLNQFPTIHKVYEALMQHPSFQRSHYQRQPDCPKD